MSGTSAKTMMALLNSQRNGFQAASVEPEERRLMSWLRPR